MYSIQREMNVFNSTSNQYIQFNVKSVNSTECYTIVSKSQ